MANPNKSISARRRLSNCASCTVQLVVLYCRTKQKMMRKHARTVIPSTLRGGKYSSEMCGFPSSLNWLITSMIFLELLMVPYLLVVDSGGLFCFVYCSKGSVEI